MSRLLIKLWLCLLILPTLVSADDDGNDHLRAKAMHERGEIVSVEQVIDAAMRRVGGRVLEVELEDEDGQLHYEIEMVDTQGQVIELFFDARSGVFLKDDSSD